jgi:hypothetical protein
MLRYLSPLLKRIPGDAQCLAAFKSAEQKHMNAGMKQLQSEIEHLEPGIRNECMRLLEGD